MAMNAIQHFFPSTKSFLSKEAPNHPLKQTSIVQTNINSENGEASSNLSIIHLRNLSSVRGKLTVSKEKRK